MDMIVLSRGLMQFIIIIIILLLLLQLFVFNYMALNNALVNMPYKYTWIRPLFLSPKAKIKKIAIFKKQLSTNSQVIQIKLDLRFSDFGYWHWECRIDLMLCMIYTLGNTVINAITDAMLTS